MCLKVFGAKYVSDFYIIKAALRLAKNFKTISLKHKTANLQRAVNLAITSHIATTQLPGYCHTSSI